MKYLKVSKTLFFIKYFKTENNKFMKGVNV